MLILNEEFKGIAGIYAIECLKNKNIYVGQSIDLYGRVMRHKSNLKSQKDSNVNLQKDYDLYGHCNFIGYCVELIHSPSKEILNEKEDKWIKKIGTYNIGPGNNSIHVGHSHSEETKNKISKSLTGKKGINTWSKGRTASPETRRKLSKSLEGNSNNLGKKHSNDVKKKISESSKLIWQKRKQSQFFEEEINHDDFKLGV